MARPTSSLLLALLAATLLLAAPSSGGRLLQEQAAPAAEGASTNGTGAANATAGAAGGETFTGDGTAFSDTVDNGINFACSYRSLPTWAKTHFAAVNAPQWDNGNACGRCTVVRCVDSRCSVQNKDVVVQIVDKCPECKHGDLDFSFPAYKDITGSWPNRLTVQWQWTECPPTDGTIRLTPKDGSNPNWQAFYFGSSRYPLKRVSLNGMELARSEFQFFQHPAPLSGPAKFEFEADNGMTVTATTDDPMKEQDLGVQFGDSA